MAHDVTVFHPGVQHSWQTALALQQLGRLSFYATSIFYQPNRWPYRIEHHLPKPLATRVHAEFRRFAGPSIDPDRVVTLGIAEWAERLASRLGRRRLATRIDRWGNRRFGRALARAVEERDPAVLWGFNGSSLELFESPVAAERARVLDRTIGDWRAYNEAMEAIHDEWRAFFPSADYRVPQALIDADDREYEAADVILAGSPFAADTVARHARGRDVANRLRVLPYCFDESAFAAVPPPRERSRTGPVRFLMLGQINVRKGAHLALEAIARISPSAATLTLLGQLQLPATTFARYAGHVTHLPAVARQDVPAVLANADVLLFPSYFEGSALSLLEALAAGLALIQSPQAGLGVTPETGLLLPELSVEAVHDAMLALIDDRERLAAFREAAPAAAAPYRFTAYRDRIAALLAEFG